MKFWRFIGIVVVYLLVLSCTGGDGNDNNGTTPDPGPQDNPVPVLTSLTPTAALKNQGEFTLTATGTDFVDGAKILFKGTEMDTTFISATELSCEVSTALTQVTALALTAAAVQVKVRNPAPGGGDSQSMTFHLRENPAFGADQVISGGHEAYWNGLDCDDEGRIYAWFQDIAFSEIEWDSKSWAYVISSEDYGQTWNTPVKFNRAGAPVFPSIATGANGEVAAVWPKYGSCLVFKRSTDYGDSWPGGKDICINIYSGSLSVPHCLIGDNGTIHMAGQVCDEEVAGCMGYYLRSTDHGVHWDMTPTIEDWWKYMFLFRASPRLALGKGVVYLLSRYRSDTPGRHELYSYIRRSLDDGLIWGDRLKISADESGSTYPSVGLAADGGDRVAGAWAYPYAVGINTSGDRGVTWMGEKTFSAGVGAVGNLDLDYDALGNLMVVWVEDGIVYFRRSVNNADSWSAPVMVTQTTGCTMPQLVITPDGSIFVSWLRGNRIHFVEGIPN